MLLPQTLNWSVRNGLWEDTRNLGLSDCIECGCCDFVCPSHIPLVDWFRFGKSELQLLGQERNNAEAARQRFEDREIRLARLKRERKQRIEEKKRALQDENEKRKKIAAAIERVRSRQGKGS
jgi:electron transport complex protein RnfC